MVARHDSWRAMQQLLHEGVCHAIGVSNFEISHLEALRLADGCAIRPAVNQIELHPCVDLFASSCANVDTCTDLQNITQPNIRQTVTITAVLR